MSSLCDESLLSQQREAVHALNKNGLAAYDHHLHNFGILDFLNEEEKKYFASLNLDDFSGSDEDDDDEEDDSEDGLHLQHHSRFQDADDNSLEVDGGTPRSAASAEVKIETRLEFSPGILEEIIKMIKKSSHSIKIAMFMFTEKSIFKEICEKKTSNPEMDVFILVDSTQFDEFLKMAKKVIRKYFNDEEVGIKVKDVMKKGNNAHGKTPGKAQGKTPGKAHEKFMIVDESNALTGSFNFTWSSEYTNYEQVIISNDQTAIVSPLLKHFKRMSRKIRYQIL